MAILAQRLNVDLGHASAHVVKEMIADPLRRNSLSHASYADSLKGIAYLSRED